MSDHLCGCGRPVQDATLCATCAHRLDDALAQICEHHGLGWDLDIAITRQAVMSDRNGPRANTTPIPYDDRASASARELHSTLGSWARLVVEETGAVPPADTITAIAAWLRPRAGWLRHHEAGGEALDEILAAVHAVRRVIDRPADMLYAGPCQTCWTDVYARVEAVYVTCPNEECLRTYSIAERRAWLLKSAENILGSTTEISRALTRYAQPVTPSAIRGYVGRGQLLARGERVEGGLVKPLYRLGDVMDCVARAAERSARIGA
jgi:hypothetical protein